METEFPTHEAYVVKPNRSVPRGESLPKMNFHLSSSNLLAAQLAPHKNSASLYLLKVL